MFPFRLNFYILFLAGSHTYNNTSLLDTVVNNALPLLAYVSSYRPFFAVRIKLVKCNMSLSSLKSSNFLLNLLYVQAAAQRIKYMV